MSVSSRGFYKDAFEGKLSVARARLRAALTNDVFTACPPFVERFRVQPETIAESSLVFLEPFPRTRPIPSCPTPAISKLVRFQYHSRNPLTRLFIQLVASRSFSIENHEILPQKGISRPRKEIVTDKEHPAVYDAARYFNPRRGFDRRGIVIEGRNKETASARFVGSARKREREREREREIKGDGRARCRVIRGAI